MVHVSESTRWVTPLQVTDGQLEISTLHVFFYPDEEDEMMDDFVNVENPNNTSINQENSGGSDRKKTGWVRAGKDDSAKRKKKLMQTAAAAAGSSGKSVMRWRLDKLVEVHNRRYLLRSTALELFFEDKTNIFVAFSSSAARKDCLTNILKQKTPLLQRAFAIGQLSPKTVFERSRILESWRNREISNFEYIMRLNTIAGRSYNDITQYPSLSVDFIRLRFRNN